MAGVISKIIGAGLKKAGEKTAKSNSLQKSSAELKRSITEYKRMLREKDYGKGKPMTKSGIEARLSAHERYLKQAQKGLRNLGGKPKSMAKKVKEPNKTMQDKATRQGKIDTKISKAKHKEGRYNKARSELLKKHQDPIKYNQTKIGDADYDVQVAAEKNTKALGKLQQQQDAIKKAAKKGSKMQTTDFKKKGLSKGPQATKKKKKYTKGKQDAVAVGAGVAGGAAVHYMDKYKDKK